MTSIRFQRKGRADPINTPKWHEDKALSLKGLAAKYKGVGFYDIELSDACARLAEAHLEVAFNKGIYSAHREPHVRLAYLRSLGRKSIAEAAFFRLNNDIEQACKSTSTAKAWMDQANREAYQLSKAAFASRNA